MTKVRTDPNVVALAGFFHRNGYVRKPSETRREKDGQKYRKGYEVRLVANTKTELRAIQRHLRAAGFSCGSPYVRSSQHIQPLYGKESVTSFLSLVQRGRKK